MRKGDYKTVLRNSATFTKTVNPTEVVGAGTPEEPVTECAQESPRLGSVSCQTREDPPSALRFGARFPRAGTNQHSSVRGRWPRYNPQLQTTLSWHGKGCAKHTLTLLNTSSALSRGTTTWLERMTSYHLVIVVYKTVESPAFLTAVSLF